tara:strand:- start:1498 stop:2412 length:915 start_codon:yes stop_codon:yes gene_type:complete
MKLTNKFPLGQYIEGNKSWLRIIDSRLKLIILSLFLITPVWAGTFWRVSVVIFLIIITFLSLLPVRFWWRSFIFLLLLSLIIGLLSIFATSNISTLEIPFRDPKELEITLENAPAWNILEIPKIKLGFLNLGPYNFSRKAINLGIKTSTLIFTVVHSVNLILFTTLKEELVWALSWFMNPLKMFGLPVDKLLFQLLLALRFIPLVQEEFQNILMSVSVRSINYRSLGFRKIFKIIISITERLLLNILLRVEQGADSLLAKGILEINTKRFIPLEEKKTSKTLADMISIFFIILAICLRKQYGAI